MFLRILKKIPRILLKVIKTISFRIYRFLLWGLSCVTLVLIVWMLGWFLYIEIKAKQLRVSLNLVFNNTISANDQNLINEKILEYDNIISKNRNESTALLKSAKRDKVKYQIKRQRARYLRAMALEYEIYSNKFKSYNVNNYHDVENFKKIYLSTK